MKDIIPISICVHLVRPVIHDGCQNQCCQILLIINTRPYLQQNSEQVFMHEHDPNTITARICSFDKNSTIQNALV
jgi:hypothetical protein